MGKLCKAQGFVLYSVDDLEQSLEAFVCIFLKIFDTHILYFGSYTADIHCRDRDRYLCLLIEASSG